MLILSFHTQVTPDLRLNDVRDNEDLAERYYQRREAQNASGRRLNEADSDDQLPHSSALHSLLSSLSNNQQHPNLQMPPTPVTTALQHAQTWAASFLSRASAWSERLQATVQDLLPPDTLCIEDRETAYWGLAANILDTGLPLFPGCTEHITHKQQQQEESDGSDFRGAEEWAELLMVLDQQQQVSLLVLAVLDQRGACKKRRREKMKQGAFPAKCAVTLQQIQTDLMRAAYINIHNTCRHAGKGQLRRQRLRSMLNGGDCSSLSSQTLRKWRRTLLTT